MLRAGLLRETIHIYELKKSTSETGSQTEKYVKTHTIKATSKKLTASMGNELNANEIFISNTLVFQVRRYSFLNENVRIKYGSRFYKIILIDKQSDNSLLITLSKING